MRIVFEHAEPLTPDIVSFWFRPERPVQFVPGQFADFQLPHEDVDMRGDSRQFSFTSLPSDELLSIAVRFPRECSSYKRALFTIAPGTALHLGEPLGDFVLPKSPEVPLVWIAGGVGSAAFVAMAKTLIGQPRRAITLLQSARTSEELLFSKIWNSSAIDVKQAVTGSDNTWNGRRGRFSITDIITPVSAHADEALFYVSGSEQMVEENCDALMVCGIQREQLVREAFTGY